MSLSINGNTASNISHDIVKMRLVEFGYLPNYPYHMISDEEMCDAFITGYSDDDIGQLSGLFADMYPCPSKDISCEYSLLVKAIVHHISEFKQCNSDSRKLPDWVYSYMLGTAIGPSSSQLNIHDLLVLLGRDNLNDVYTAYAASECLNISESWVNKIQHSDRYKDVNNKLIDLRPPTMFGEPHVIKALRVRNAQQFK